MIVKRSSSSIASVASSQGGRVRRRVVASVRGEPVEVVIREDVLQRGSSSRTASTLASCVASSQTIADRLGVREEVADVAAPSSTRTRERRRRRSARARSRGAPSRGCCARGARRCRPCARRGRASPFAYARTRSSASAHDTSRQPSSVLDEVGRASPRPPRPRRARAARSFGAPGPVASRGRLQPSRSRSELRAGEKGFADRRAKSQSRTPA